MTAPPPLRRGDTIALVSPSARIHAVFPLRVARATAWLEEQDYTVRLVTSADDVPRTPLSAHARARATELHAAFADADVKAIICCIGGLSANELLPYLDADLISRNKKIFMGSSDITLLHQWLYTQAGLRTFYGPSIITSLGEWPAPLAFTAGHMMEVLTVCEPYGGLPRSADYMEEFFPWEEEGKFIAEGTMRARVSKPNRGWKWLKKGSGSVLGPLQGGCLPSLLQLMGTPYGVDYTDTILLIETPEGDEPGTGIPLERATWNLLDLRLRGVLGQIRGLVVGRPYLFSEEDKVQWEEEIVRATEGFDFPVLSGVDAGHTDPMLTLPLGAEVRLDAERDVWEVREAGVVKEG